MTNGWKIKHKEKKVHLNTCTHNSRSCKIDMHMNTHTLRFPLRGLSVPCLIHVPILSGVTDL